MSKSAPVSHGFTLMEAILALVFIGIVSAVTIPGIMYSINNNTALFRVKNMMKDIQAAAQTYQQQNQSTPQAHAADLTPYLKYTATDTSSTNLFSPNTMNPNHEFMEFSCATSKCYLFPDGGVLVPDEPEAAWTASGSGDTIVTYLYDPDNSGPYMPMVFQLDTVTLRIAPRPQFEASVAGDNYSASNDSLEDPPYLNDLVNGIQTGQ